MCTAFGVGDDAHHVNAANDPSSVDNPPTNVAASAPVQPSETPSAPADALEMAAGSMFALEATLSKVGLRPEAEEAIRSAIELVRTAIDDLQSEAGAGANSGLELGFVMRQRRSDRAGSVPAGDSTGR